MSHPRGDIDSLHDRYVQNADSHLRIHSDGLPYLALVPNARRLGVAALRSDPAGLQSPYRRANPFVGRDAELADLWEWLHSPPPVSFRAVVGLKGKTRLAVELMLRLEEAPPDPARDARSWTHGWAGGRELRRFAAQDDLPAWRWRTPTLIVVDDAAAHASSLRTLLRTAAVASNHAHLPLRILLLDRTADPLRGWLQTLREWDPDAGRLDRLFHSPLLALPSPDPRNENRWKILGEAVEFESKRIASAFPEDEAARQKLLRLAAVVAFTGELTADALERAAAEEYQDSGVEASAAPALAEALRRILPEAQGAASAVDPSSVGEYFLRAVFQQIVGSSEARDRLLLRAAELEPEATVSTARRFYGDHGGDASPAASLAALVSAAGSNLRIEEALLGTLHRSGQALDLLRARIHRLRALPPTFESRLKLAQSHTALSMRLDNREWTELALPPAEDAVAQYHELAAERPLALRAPLAAELLRLVPLRRRLGRSEQALEATQESAALLRGLSAEDPLFREELVQAYHSVADGLADLGRLRDALPPAEKALAIARLLAAEAPKRFLHELAEGMKLTAYRFWTLDRFDEAIALYEESLEIERRSLADFPPGDGGPRRNTTAGRMDRLACDHGMQAWHLNELGRPAEALVHYDRAIEVQRTWLAAHPQDAEHFDFFKPLDRRVDRLVDLGRWEEALAQAEQIAEFGRISPDGTGSAFDLVDSSAPLANLLAKMGRRDEALAHADRTIETCRRRVEEGVLCRSKLVQAIQVRIDLLAAGRPEEASAESEALVQYCRRAAEEDGEDRSLEADALQHRARHLSASGRGAEAVAAAEAALEIRRSQAEGSSGVRFAEARAWDVLSEVLRSFGRPDEAIAAAEASFEIGRQVLLESSLAPSMGMPMNRERLADLCCELGRTERAMIHREAAVQGFRLWAETHPGRTTTWGDSLARACLKLADHFDTLGRPDKALARNAEAVAVLQEVVPERPALQAEWAAASGLLADRLIAAGRLRDALPHARAAVEGFRVLKKPQPDKLAAAVQRLESLQRLLETSPI